MSTATSLRNSNYISNTRQAATDLLHAFYRLQIARQQFDMAGFSTTPIPSGDFVGENEGLTAADVLAVMVTVDVLRGVLIEQFHAQNLQKVAYK